jgi:hypothetical protein
MEEKTEEVISEQTHSVEYALQMLWDKAREASVVISTLREEKKKLVFQIDELEKELRQTRHDMLIQKSEMEKLRTECSVEQSANGTFHLAEKDVKEIQEKLTLLLLKINSYL